MVVSWTEGPDHGLVWDHGLAVVDASVPTDVVSRLWADLCGGDDLAGFLKRLGAGVGADLLSLPSFAIALRGSGGGWQLAARGALEVRVDDVLVRGADISTWAERFLPEGRTVVLGTVDAAASARPIVAGLVPVAGLTWGDASAVAQVAAPAGFVVLSKPEPKPLPVPEPEPVPAPEPESQSEPEPEPVPEQEPEPEAEQEPGPVPEQEPEPEAEQEPEPEAEPVPEPDGAAPGGGVPTFRRAEASGEATLIGDEPAPADAAPPVESAPQFAVAAAVQLPAEPPTPGRFARQYGETQMFSVQDAAVREREEPPFIAGVPGSDAPASPESASPVPASPESAPAPGPELPDAFDEDGDHDGYTIMADGAGPSRVPAVEPVDDAVPGGPTVLGVLCVQGHANPPHRAECGLCGGRIVGEPRRVERPSLGTVVAPNGERIELTAPLIVGRTPRADRIQGPVMPRLVPLSQGHVSGNHLELRLEEWSVLAVDLHSTNGTFLRRHGEAPVRLGERPELLIQGDVLDLGHGVQFILERLR